MGYLDELKRLADAQRSRAAVDGGALERNTLTTDGVCHAAARYFGTLAQQLNVLQPVSPAVLRFDPQHDFRNLRLSDFRADSRLKKLRSVEVFDHVALAFAMKTGRMVTMAKDFPPAIDKLEARLAQCGTPFQSENVRDPENGKFIERRFEFRADFAGSVRLLPDHDTAWVTFRIVNLEGLCTTTVRFPAIEVGGKRLDELARWIVGEPNAFLDGGHELRRVEL